MPVSGAWRLSYSMISQVVNKENNLARLYFSGDRLDETIHQTYSSAVYAGSTGGRVVNVEASAGDTIKILTTRIDGHYKHIHFCAEYISKI